MKNRTPKTPRRNLRANLAQNCGQINGDDCIDPRDYFKPVPKRNKPDRKTLQLCRQVEHTLSFVLCDDREGSMLGMLQVISVVPAPDAPRLLVTLYADNDQTYDHQKALVDLENQKGRLRCEIANSISRKRTPLLIYNVLPPLFEDGAEIDE